MEHLDEQRCYKRSSGVVVVRKVFISLKIIIINNGGLSGSQNPHEEIHGTRKMGRSNMDGAVAEDARTLLNVRN